MASSIMACTTSVAAAAAAPRVGAGAAQGGNVSRSSRLSMAPFRSSLCGQKLQIACSSSSARIVAAAETQEAPAEAPAGFTPPQLNPDTPSPIFGGSTGGLLRKAQVEEFYVITWEAKKEQIFELPTGGAAIMRAGPNLLKLARKEQCLALGSRLRANFKINYQFYRVFPNGEVQYLHPKDGVYPEKVNPGREAVNVRDRPIGKNVNPIEVKFTGKLAIDL